MDLYAHAHCSCAVESGSPDRDRRNQMIETYKGCEEPLFVRWHPIVRRHVPYSSTKFCFIASKEED
jgi:hypothetical protein